MKGEEYFKKLINGKSLSAIDTLVLLLLKLVSHLYALVMRSRVLCYRLGIFRSYSLAKPVISVGNIVVGGTGKTPMTLWIARYLMSRGKKTAVLTRGYGGRLEGKVAVVSDGVKRLLSAQDAGDEPSLLADLLPGLIVVMGSNRYEAGCLAIEKFSPDCFILDDGFQHLKLKRDLDILLLDASRPFGNERTFPAGLLREPPSAVNRADLVVFTRCNEENRSESLFFEGIPLARATHKLTGFQCLAEREVRPFAELASLNGLAFAGIADPESFFNSLEAAGLHLTATLSFPDHTDYGDDETAALARLRISTKADYLITTAKDAVKLGSAGGREIPFYVAVLEIAFHDERVISRELDKLL